MFGDWFNVKEVDEFADSIISDLIKRLPPTGVEGPPKKAAERLRKTHGVVFRRIEDFARANSLNLYKRARLGNRIKWGLGEAGYPPDFVETVTIELLEVVTLSPRKR